MRKLAKKRSDTRTDPGIFLINLASFTHDFYREMKDIHNIKVELFSQEEISIGTMSARSPVTSSSTRLAFFSAEMDVLAL